MVIQPGQQHVVDVVVVSEQVKLQRLIQSATQGPRRVMHNAAIDIQRIFRGYLARQRVKQLRIRRRFYYAARKITNAARMWMDRREAARGASHLSRSASKYMYRSVLLRHASTPRKKGSLVTSD